jgi:hypothetical protein
MLDIWSFLLQTLTVSGVAALILLIKALFKDKLPLKWLGDLAAVTSVIMIVAYLVAGVLLMKALFDLRRCLPTDA